MNTENCPGASACCNPSWCKTASKCLHEQSGQQRPSELVPMPQPVAWRHSLTHTVHETEHEVQLADAESEAVPLYLRVDVQALRDLADSEGTDKVMYMRQARKAQKAIDAALPAMREFARKNPKHHFGDTLQDPCGVHAWLAKFGAQRLR